MFRKFGRHDKLLKGELQKKISGKPIGSDLRIDKLEVLLGKRLRKKKTRPKGP